MSFSSGVFTLVAGNPVVTGTTVSSTWANNTLNDIATGLSTCILKDGTQTATATIPFTNITASGTLGVTGTSTLAAVNASGIVLTTVQPAFEATAASNPQNVTGDATTYAVVFSSSDFDVASNYNSSTGIFTAPVTGKYSFSGFVSLAGILSGHTSCNINIVTTARNYQGSQQNPFVVLDGNGNIGFNVGVSCADMTAGDTAKITVQVAGSTKVVDINTSSFFSGRLVG